ncbi:MAG: prolyl oligopeptidase family serine peptidase [Pseudomonadota bacterium]
MTWGRPPWRQPSPEGDSKLTSSPSDRFQFIRTPVLALHGEADSRVSATHSRLLHNVLTDLGVPSRLVLFPDEGHSISRPNAAKIWWQELFAWLQAGTEDA